MVRRPDGQWLITCSNSERVPSGGGAEGPWTAVGTAPLPRASAAPSCVRSSGQAQAPAVTSPGTGHGGESAESTTTNKQQNGVSPPLPSADLGSGGRNRAETSIGLCGWRYTTTGGGAGKRGKDEKGWSGWNRRGRQRRRTVKMPRCSGVLSALQGIGRRGSPSQSLGQCQSVAVSQPSSAATPVQCTVTRTVRSTACQ